MTWFSVALGLTEWTITLALENNVGVGNLAHKFDDNASFFS